MVTRLVLGALILVPLQLLGCQSGDVGAPCNHGSIDAPETKLVTFPALSCNDLICVYGEEKAGVDDPCNSNEDCNEAGEQVFVCTDDACKLSLDYVLSRSMCSKRCSDDADCNNDGPTHKPAVDAEDTDCKTEFKCVVLQQLGEFCCEKLCVCNDELPNLMELINDCQDPMFCEEQMMN